MTELVDDVRIRRPRRNADILEEDDALTKTEVMLARGYEHDPETGAWRLPRAGVIA